MPRTFALPRSPQGALAKAPRNHGLGITQGPDRGAHPGDPTSRQDPPGRGVKLSSVATDILGKSGRDMLEALVAGTRDPKVLAELARGKLRNNLSELKYALTGRFSSHRALLVGEILAKLDYQEEAIGRLSVEVDRLIAPFAAEVALLDTIPGVNRRIAECLVAEIGVDMARFSTSGRLPPGPGCARGIMSRAASESPAGHARARSGSPPTSRRPPRPRGARRALTSERSSSICVAGSASPRRVRPTSTRSLSRRSTSSTATSPTQISAWTGSKRAVPTLTPGVSLARSRPSATGSPSSRPKPPEQQLKIGTSSRAGLCPAPCPRAC